MINPILKINFLPTILSERGGKIKMVEIMPRKKDEPINPIFILDSHKRSYLSALIQFSMYSSSGTALYLSLGIFSLHMLSFEHGYHSSPSFRHSYLWAGLVRKLNPIKSGVIVLPIKTKTISKLSWKIPILPPNFVKSLLELLRGGVYGF